MSSLPNDGPLSDVRRWTAWYRDTAWGVSICRPNTHEKEVLSSPWNAPGWTVEPLSPEELEWAQAVAERLTGPGDTVSRFE